MHGYCYLHLACLHYAQNVMFIDQLGADVSPDFHHQETTGHQSCFPSPHEPWSSAGWVKHDTNTTQTHKKILCIRKWSSLFIYVFIGTMSVWNRCWKWWTGSTWRATTKLPLLRSGQNYCFKTSSHELKPCAFLFYKTFGIVLVLSVQTLTHAWKTEIEKYYNVGLSCFAWLIPMLSHPTLKLCPS